MANFGFAIEEMRRGGGVSRVSWPATFNMQIKLQVPDEHSKMTMPYFYMSIGEDAKYPWTPSTEELLAHDWNPVGKKSRLILPPKVGGAVN